MSQIDSHDAIMPGAGGSARWRIRLLAAISLGCVVAAFFVPPIAQDPSYHHFADRATLLGVPNFWNVMSNLAFVLAGVYGLLTASRLDFVSLRPQYLLLCTAAVLIGTGSAYYHYSPTTQSLLWDRLPMAIAFMALFSALLNDRISPRLGQRMLLPLLILGVGSVLYWVYTEMDGRGDLRPYALVQFLPVVLIPLMLLLFKGRGLRTGLLWAVIAVYVFAKVAEHFDREIFLALQVISGHSIKHVAAAMGLLFAILAMQRTNKT